MTESVTIVQTKSLAGRDVWFAMQVDDGKKEALAEALAHEVLLELTDYGTVIDSGYGEPPKFSLQKRIESKLLDDREG